jgi:uncharacterized membrane protein
MIPLLAVLLFFTINIKLAFAEDSDTIKAQIEEIEINQETEGKYTAKIKVQLLEGTYAGTSLYTDYEGDTRLQVGDEIFVTQTIYENELQKVDYVGFNRSSYLIWLTIAAAIIIISMIAIKSPKELTPIILLGAVINLKVFNFTFTKVDQYLGAIIVVSIVIILSNIIKKGFNILNLIATISGLAGIALTLVLQIFFSSAMRIPNTDRTIFDIGIMIASAGLIFGNAQKIVFELESKLKISENANRSKLLRESMEISGNYSSFAVNALFWGFIGLFFPIIYASQESTSYIGFFNDPKVAQITTALLSSIIGLLIVPITTTILSFFIIDVNNLGRRVPKKKQIEMNV